MKLEDCIYEEVGIVEGITIAACTDSGGSQVIVGSRHETLHMLSKDFGTQDAARIEAKRIIKYGISKTTQEYDNLKTSSGGFASFANIMIRSQFEKKR